MVIGTDTNRANVAAARAHLNEAGLADYTDICEGDLRDTPGQVDFMLVDIWVPHGPDRAAVGHPGATPGATTSSPAVSTTRTTSTTSATPRTIHLHHHARRRRTRISLKT